MTLTIEQVVDDLRRYAEQFDEAATMALLAPRCAASYRPIAQELRNAADHYERGELMVQEDA